MIFLIADIVVIALIIVHICYLRWIYLENIRMDAEYAKLVNDHIDILDSHVELMDEHLKHLKENARNES